MDQPRSMQIAMRSPYFIAVTSPTPKPGRSAVVTVIVSPLVRLSVTMRSAYSCSAACDGMFCTWTVCVIFLAKNHISVKTAGTLTQYLTGGTLTMAFILIGFSVVKSFALVFPPAVLFVVSGIVFEHFWTAVLVNCVATACSLVLPYFLGRFTGKEMVDALKGRFKAIRKLDDFTGANSFAVVFVFKAGGFMPSDLSSLIFGAMGIPFAGRAISARMVFLSRRD